MGLFNFFRDPVKQMSKLGRPVDPKWATNKDEKFYRLLTFDGEAAGVNNKGGIFIVWHGGVRPGWVFVGASKNLGSDIQWCQDNQEIQHYERFGGLYVSWSPIATDYRSGAVRYLTQIAKPMVKNPVAPSSSVDPVPLLLPGAKAE